MKKYLMMTLAAIAFASCSNNDVFDADRSKVQDTYDAAFRKYVGVSINPNQDWGFGTAVSAPAFDFTRAVPGIQFPSFNDDNCPEMPTQYKNTLEEAIAAGAIYTKDYAEEHPHDKYPEGAVLYIDEDYPQFGGENQVGNVKNLTIYVDGNITLLGGFNQGDESTTGTTLCVTKNSTLTLRSVGENLTIYLAPGATLDLSQSETYVWNSETNSGGFVNGATFTKSTAALYMSSGSTVSGGALFFKDGYTVLNEAGTIDVGELHVENGAILYNKKDIEASGVIALRNTNGEIDNFGKMSGASMTLDANARFYNVAGGEVNIENSTTLNNDSGYNAWMNDGQFNTGSFEITGGCQDPCAFNNCHMQVNGEFFMNHGNFVLDGGAAVECESFKWESDNYFHMGSKALLNVEGEMLMHNSNSYPQYGFWGDGSEYAVIQAGSIEKYDKGKFRAAYYGNLFIDTDSHFGQGETSADGTYYFFDESVKFSFTDNTDISDLTSSPKRTAQKATNFSITIPKDNKGCTPGYSYIDDNTPKPDIRIIAEDLSASDDSDFDFNDVVFDVTFTSETTATITLKAAGGTLPLRVAGIEVHDKFGGYSVKTMINTHAAKYATNGYAYADNVPEVSFDISGIDRNENGKDILVEVQKQDENGNDKWYPITAEQGEPAAKLGVDPKFQWVDEKVSLKSVYDQFTGWVANPSVKWY